MPSRQEEQSRRKIAAIIPLFNREAYICDAVESALGQTRHPDEVIVIDDGSTDGGGHKVRERFPGVRVISQLNQGVGPARNTGMRSAQSDWVAFLDADDIWLPHHLSEIDTLLDLCPSCVLASTDHIRVRSDKAFTSTPQQKKVTRREINYLRAAGRNSGVFHTDSVVAHRETFLRIGGFGSERPGQDLTAWLRLSVVGPTAFSTSKTAVYFSHRGVMEQRKLEQLASKPETGEGPEFDQLSVTNLSAAERLAREYRDTISDDNLRTWLNYYCNGRLAQSALVKLRLNQLSLAKDKCSLMDPPIAARHRIICLLVKLPSPIIGAIRKMVLYLRP